MTVMTKKSVVDEKKRMLTVKMNVKDAGEVSSGVYSDYIVLFKLFIRF